MIQSYLDDLQIPLDVDLFHELNVERYEFAKTGKILFNHMDGTYDDKFWVVALTVYTTEQAPQPRNRPLVYAIN